VVIVFVLFVIAYVTGLDFIFSKAVQRSSVSTVHRPTHACIPRK
jgi:hypothetical protein